MTAPAILTVDTVVSAVGQIGMTAERINALHAAALESTQTALECARRCGELLLFAKGEIPHGEWLAWLKNNTTVSERMAQRYMRLASRWDDIRNLHDPTRVSEMSLRAAMQAVMTPTSQASGDADEPVASDDDADVIETLTRAVQGIANRCPADQLPGLVAQLRLMADQLDGALHAGEERAA